MCAALNSSATILVAADSTANAGLVKTLLENDFGRIALSTSPGKATEDFQLAQPDVLVLAFNGIEKSEHHYLGLFRQGGGIHHDQHRTIVLCTRSEVKKAYTMCRDGLFDDYVLFWPMTHDPTRLSMAVHHAVREVTTARIEQPDPAKFALQARRIGELASLLEQRMAHEKQDLEDTASALRKAEMEIGAAVEGSLRHLFAAIPHGPVGSDAIERLERELARLREEAIAQPFQVLAGAVQPDERRVREFATACAPHLASVRALGALARHVRPTLLVIDDDELQHQFVRSALQEQPYQLVFASSGPEALNLLRRLHPDLILLDVMMPGMDGLEVARQIKATARLAAVPIIMLTGHSEKNTVQDSLVAGAIDFVVKPFDRARLIARVARVLDGDGGGTSPSP